MTLKKELYERLWIGSKSLRAGMWDVSYELEITEEGPGGAREYLTWQHVGKELQTAMQVQHTRVKDNCYF